MTENSVEQTEGEVEQGTTFGMRWQMVLLAGLSLSIGWGIRGNFGHEYGAALPGAMTAMAVALMSGRQDWYRRVHYFALFGALGWAFGGSIAYMSVIAYTHSGHSLSQWYGFVCLFIIGFLWGAGGGAGTALPAYLSRERLTEFFAPMTAIFLAWMGWDLFDAWRERNLHNSLNSDFRHLDPYYWYDTDWPGILAAMVVVLLVAAIRAMPRKNGGSVPVILSGLSVASYLLYIWQRMYAPGNSLWIVFVALLVVTLLYFKQKDLIDRATALILHMTIGWIVGFLILTVWLHLRMNPPRGDSWAGITGMVVGMLVFFQRNGLPGLTFAALVSGFVGGLGFSGATLLKLIEMKSGYDTNWHSILEQSYGLINGLGIALTMGLLMPRAPRVSDDPPVRRWTEGYAVCFTLLLLTYLNCEKLVHDDWIPAKTVPEVMYFFSTQAWFDLAYLGVAICGVLLVWAHLRRPLPIVPTSWLGKGQMLYVTFLWWMVIANFVKAVVHFAPQRLVTEGTIHFNALVSTVLLLLGYRATRTLPIRPLASYTPWLRKALVFGLLGMVVVTTLEWAGVRALYGDQQAPGAGRHIRFGADSNSVATPNPKLPHP